MYGDQFGSLSLTEASPPQEFEEPFTVAEAQTFLRDFDATNEDDIADFITAAREQAEILQGRDLIRKQYDYTCDFWPEYRVRLRDPLVSVELVQYRDDKGNVTTLVENTDYIVDTNKHPGVITPPFNSAWPTYTPWPSSSLLIRFTSGYSPTSPFWSNSGSRVKVGMKYLISSWFNNRLPFERGIGATNEYPYTVSACLSYGSLMMVR